MLGIDIAYLCTKLDHCSITKIYMVDVIWPRPFQE